MNALVVVGAAAIAAVAIARRKTLKEDAERVSAVAKDGASKLNERVRGAEGASPVGDDAAVDAEPGADADDAAASEATEAADGVASEAADATEREGS